MAKHFFKGDMTLPQITGKSGTWVLAAADTITIDAANPLAGISTAAGGADLVLDIRGNILMSNADHTGVEAGGENTIVRIGAQSNIVATHGIVNPGGLDRLTIENAGAIDAVETGIDTTAHRTVIGNSGSINAKNALVLSVEAARITNSESGVISGQTGISLLDGKEGKTVAIINDGMISAMDDAITTSGLFNSNVHLTNRGQITGDIMLGSGHDVIDTRAGAIDGMLAGGLGNDTYLVASSAIVIFEDVNSGNDLVRARSDFILSDNLESLTLLGVGDFNAGGNDLANTLLGNRGDNSLMGLNGKDRLWGRAGDDSLNGGGDADTFVFARNGDRDVILDFQDSVDHIEIRGFAGIKSFDQLESRMSAAGDDVVIKFGNGDRLIIENTDMAKLTEDDFFFF